MAVSTTSDDEPDEDLAAYLSELETHDSINRVHYDGDMIEVLFDGELLLGHLLTQRMLGFGYVVRMASEDTSIVYFETVESMREAED